VKYFRLINKIFASTPLGYGRAGGRWNFPGTPIIYASNVSAITFMELLAIKGPVVANGSWVLITIQINADAPHLMSEDLPPDWGRRPYPTSTQAFGTNWAQSMMSPFLKVPSCRIPLSSYSAEHNLLINPLHPEAMKSMKIIAKEEVSFELNEWG